MTRLCHYCDDLILEENFTDHLTECMKHLPVPPPPGRYLVTCGNPDCLLAKGCSYADYGNAELLAWAHEQRFSSDYPVTHFCDVKDLNQVQPSMEPKTATGAKEAGNG